LTPRPPVAVGSSNGDLLFLDSVLQLVQTGVLAAVGEQLDVAALFDQTAVVEHQQAVGIAEMSRWSMMRPQR
jgi:hypothetical protein